MTLEEHYVDEVWYYQSRVLENPTEAEMRQLRAEGWNIFRAKEPDNSWVAWKKFKQIYDWNS